MLNTQAHILRRTRLAARAQPVLTELPATQADPSRVAVLLNRNARQVTPALVRQLERICGEHLYDSHSLAQAEVLCREIVQRGYGTVVCGGGDGTLMRTVNLVHRYVEESNAWRLTRLRHHGEVQSKLTPPRFAFLALGTGNGLRKVVGAGQATDDLRTILESPPGPNHSLPMISWGKERFLFGGLGYDSMLLNDYNWLKARATGRLARAAMHSLAGYVAALFMRTLPRLAMGGPKLEVRVLARAPGYYIDPRRGDAAIPIAAGQVLYEGPLSMLGVGTTPFFGYGMRIFPFAQMAPRMMQLRIAKVGAARTLAHLPAIWKGSYRNPSDLFDFLVSDVSIELSRPFPFQHSGDAQGMVQRLDLNITDTPLELVDLYTTRLPNSPA